MSPDRRRLFVLLAWNGAPALPVVPVGVLGVEPTPHGPRTCVSWVPLTHTASWPWRERLAATTPTPRVLEHWLHQEGALRLREVDAAAAPSLPHLVEGLLDQVLAEPAAGQA